MLFIDLANQHHFDDIQRLLVRHPHAAHVAAGDAQLVEHLIDLRPAAVDDYRIDADVFEQHDILGKAFFQLLVHHGVAAILDDEGFAVETPKIRQRLHQHFRFADKIFHRCPIPQFIGYSAIGPRPSRSG